MDGFGGSCRGGGVVQALDVCRMFRILHTIATFISRNNGASGVRES